MSKWRKVGGELRFGAPCTFHSPPQPSIHFSPPSILCFAWLPLIYASSPVLSFFFCVTAPSLTAQKLSFNSFQFVQPKSTSSFLASAQNYPPWPKNQFHCIWAPITLRSINMWLILKKWRKKVDQMVKTLIIKHHKTNLFNSQANFHLKNAFYFSI